ncbi:MAG: FkbM family methyltransferase, partial [Verrucomicrobiales bacterium]|nr:FkbM family methyltransferase [Verrucomicrobiales bacterium]
VSHYPHLPDWGSDVASLGGEDQERWTKRYGAQWTIENVPARRLSRLLAEAGIDDFDVLSIDAEGHDFEVLSGLDFARYQPQLVVVEFGSRKDDIRRLLERHGYAIAQDNRQDFVAVKPASVAPRIAPAPAPTNADADAAAPDALGPVSPDRLPSLLERLNPHLLALRTLPLDRPIVRADLAPADLLSAARFDLPAQLLYARHRALGVHAEHAARVYEEHVRAFSKGSCREGDGIKSGLEDYVRAFDAVLDSVRERGLDPRVSLMPVDRHHVPIDGAHRAAAAIAFDSRVPALVFDFQANRYDWRFFRDRGLPESTLDALALEFVRHRTDTHFLHLFPTAEGRDAEVRALLQEHGTIVYEKSLRLTGEGPATLVRELYAREAWIGTWANGFAGARKDASVRFSGTDALRLFLFCCDDLDRAKALKARVRELFGQGNYSCHVNDSHEETLRLARTYFNANSVHFLNHARPRYLQRFHRHLEIYREWLRASGADPEGFCVDGSASLAAYGLRDAQDLDVLHLGAADFTPLRPGVNSHNDHVAHHAVGRDRILFDPEHHFYYAGLKFVALPTLRAMKSRRAEGKDLADVALIDELAAQPATPARPVVDVLAKDAPREALRVYYVPNGDDYHIAALLERLYTTVQPFGCRDVRDYIERRVLAYKTPNAGIRMWDEVQAMRPDIVYVESARNIDPSVLQRIRTELGIPVTMWFGDACVNDEFVQRILSYASSVTHQVTVDRHVARAARQKGLGNVEFVPFFGYDHYFRPLEEPKSIDILFSGKSYCRSFKRYPFAAERLAFVQRVDREFGARLLVVGEDWESLGLSNLQPKRVPEWDVNRLNNQSRIVLAYDAAHVDGFTSCRTYHALLGRTFVLLRKFPGAERLFINREHLVWFETEQEGIDLLRHYLAHPEECDRIARSGYQHVRANGWMFSNVVRHLVHRGLGRYSRSFEEVFAPFSKSLPQTGDASASSRASTGSATSPSPAPASPPKAKAKAGPKRTANAVDDCLRQADRFFRENNLAQARSWLERALDLEPSAADIWVASGNLAIQLGDVEQGIQELRRASELRPDHAPTLAALAAAYVRGGHVEEFEKALASALAADPDEPSAVRLLADLNFQCGHFKDAANGFYRLARKNPSDIDALLPLGVCF